MGRSQGQFQQWITKVRSTLAVPPDEEDLLQRLEKKWAELDAAEQEAIELHGKGNAEKAKTLLLTEIHDHLSKDAYDLCEKLIASNDRYVKQIMEKADTRIRVTTWVVALSVFLTLGLGGTLVWMFLYRVLLPLRGMVADARLFRGNAGGTTDEDEMRSMGSYFRELMSDVTDTRSRLERSRMRLAAAEKLAAVGKLAATVAHEIRNPLTAMEMWLFAIQEQVQGDAELERKLGIISEEMTRLESIIRNFLEFSRPMELHCRPMDVNCVVQQTLDFVRATSEATQHSGCQCRDRRVARDPGRCGQAQAGLHQPDRQCAGCHGRWRRDSHRQTVENDAAGRRMVVVRFHDSGSGIPKDVQGRIFDPFFTTKEDGTGLGLCIAAQVMARHEGSLVLESSTENGTTFTVWLPALKEGAHG